MKGWISKIRFLNNLLIKSSTLLQLKKLIQFKFLNHKDTKQRDIRKEFKFYH